MRLYITVSLRRAPMDSGGMLPRRIGRDNVAALRRRERKPGDILLLLYPRAALSAETIFCERNRCILPSRSEPYLIMLPSKAMTVT